MSKLSAQPYRLALFGLKSSGKTCFLTSGCLNVMHNDGELTCTREIPHQRPEGPESSWHSDDPVVQRQRGYEWLNHSLERVTQHGQFPSGSANQEYLVRFSLTRPQRGKHEVEIMDYGGELHDFLEVNQDERSEALRKKLMLNEGLIVLIETPEEAMSPSRILEYQAELSKLRDGLQVLLGRHQKADRFPGPIAIVFSKWDRMWRPSDKITTQEVERERFERFLTTNNTLSHVKQIQQLLQQIDHLSPVPAQTFFVSSFGYLSQGKLNLERGLCSYFIANPLSWLTQEVDRYQVEALNNKLKRQGLHRFSEAELAGVEQLKARLQHQTAYQDTITLINHAHQKQQRRKWLYYALVWGCFLLMVAGAIIYKNTQQTTSIKTAIEMTINKTNSPLPELEERLQQLAPFCVKQPKEAAWCATSKESLESMWLRGFEELRSQKNCEELEKAINRSKYRPKLSETQSQIMARCAQEGIEPDIKATLDNSNATFEELEARLKTLIELSKQTSLSETLQGYKTQLNEAWLKRYQHNIASLACESLKSLARSHELQSAFRPATPHPIAQDAQVCVNERYIKGRLEAYKTQQIPLEMMRADLNWQQQNKTHGPEVSFEALNQALSERWTVLINESKEKLNCSALNELLADPKPVSVQGRVDEEGKACEAEKYIKGRQPVYDNQTIVTMEMIEADQTWHAERCTIPLKSTQEICAQFKSTLTQSMNTLLTRYEENLSCGELKEALQRLQSSDPAKVSLCAYKALRDQATRDLEAAKIKASILLSEGELITEHHELVNRWLKFYDKSRRKLQDPITVTFTELKEVFEEGKGAFGDCESDWTGCKITFDLIAQGEVRRVKLKISASGNMINEKFEVNPQAESFQLSVKWFYDGYFNDEGSLSCQSIELSSFGSFAREAGNAVQCYDAQRKNFLLFAATTESPYLKTLPER